MTTILQAKMIVSIAENELTPVNGARPTTRSDAETWADVIICTPEDKGVFTSLQNAGLVWHSGGKYDAAVGLTEKGFALYNRIKDEDEV